MKKKKKNEKMSYGQDMKIKYATYITKQVKN